MGKSSLLAVFSQKSPLPPQLKELTKKMNTLVQTQLLDFK